MILSSKVVVQAVDRQDNDRFYKEYVTVNGPVPIALVRKRAATGQGTPKPTRAPILLIHGYGQNRYAWHVPARSMVNYLARAGYDVFNVDLRGHGRSAHLGAKNPTGPHEYVQEDIPAALDEITAITGHKKVFVVGHSLGGLVAYGMAALYPQRLAGVITIGSPYHFTRGTRGLRLISRLVHGLDKRIKVLDEFALELHTVGEVVRLSRRFVESPIYFLPFRGYHPDNVEKRVLSQHMSLSMDLGSVAVVKQMFRWAEERGDPDQPGGMDNLGLPFESQEDMPLLVIAGSKDDLAPPESVRTAYERSRAGDKTYRLLPAGHLDLVLGTNSPLTTWPIVNSWIAQRLSRLQTADTPESVRAG